MNDIFSDEEPEQGTQLEELDQFEAAAPRHALRRSLLGRPVGDAVPVSAIQARYGTAAS